eukprot:CAMPEP_0116947718 /NCGR_PEP_ID=MMETSP0467-20121206/37850_1 /TAXON_ID=283647 /ORGANISM="Mesodinium pulex, Strain SPMC105" /LENGTH=31 /DNA_ID= /DNA_START= /DNA_END= /DNA_ORIENTATION=
MNTDPKWNFTEEELLSKIELQDIKIMQLNNE